MNRSMSRLLVLTLCFVAFTSSPLAQIASKVTSAASTATPANLLDINTATSGQLKALQGIGDAYSKRIIDGRPYTAKNQLTTRGVLPLATYDVIKDHIIARAVKK